MNRPPESFRCRSCAQVVNEFCTYQGLFASFKILLTLIGGVVWLTPTVLAAQTASPVTLNGIIHSDSDDTLAFTPDGSTVFFDRSKGPHKTIMISHHIRDHWSKPTVASFSGHCRSVVEIK